MWVTTTPKKYSDGGKTRVHQVVVEALEDHDGVDLDSGDWVLYDYVDPDPLDDLFDHDGNTVMSVKFEIEEATVTVWHDGEVHVKVE